MNARMPASTGRNRCVRAYTFRRRQVDVHEKVARAHPASAVDKMHIAVSV